MMCAFVDRRRDLGGGSLLDLGIYAIIYCQFVFQQEPKSITATGTLNADGVDLEMSGELNYGNNKVGKIKSSVVKTLNNTAKIIGTKGQITVYILMAKNKLKRKMVVNVMIGLSMGCLSLRIGSKLLVIIFTD